MNGKDSIIARRRWLITLARYSALGGIGLFAWNLVARSHRDCFRLTLPCQDCGLLTLCRLPRAVAAKRQPRDSPARLSTFRKSGVRPSVPAHQKAVANRTKREKP